MSRIQYVNDVNGSFQEAHGSDGRLNVSSRYDTRIYYNSRDEGQAYALTFDDASCTAGDYVVSLFNEKTDGKSLVIHSIGVNSTKVGSFKLHRVTGTAGGGAVSASPMNLNFSSVNTATVTASTVANSDSSPISGLTSSGVLDDVAVEAGAHEEFNIGDAIRLGEDQGIAIELEIGDSASRAFGTIVFYFE